MLLQRISQQGAESLEARYTNFGGGDNPPYDECGRMMLSLMRYLQTIPPFSTIWAHTSMNALILDDADDYRTSFGHISAWAGVYQISMDWKPPVPPSFDDLLWANAYAEVVGRTNELPIAGQMIAAMIEHAPRTRLSPRMWIPALLETPPPSIRADPPNPLRVATARNAESLTAFYHDLTQHADDYRAKSGQRMLQLIEHLEATAIPCDVWVYRDDEGLVFVPNDAIMPGITVKPGGDGYMISYPWSGSVPGWENASVECRTDDSTKAAQLIQAVKTHLYRSH